MPRKNGMRLPVSESVIKVLAIVSVDEECTGSVRLGLSHCELSLFSVQFIVKFSLPDCLPYFLQNNKMKYGIRHHLTMINPESAPDLQVTIRAWRSMFTQFKSNRGLDDFFLRYLNGMF